MVQTSAPGQVQSLLWPLEQAEWSCQSSHMTLQPPLVALKGMGAKVTTVPTYVCYPPLQPNDHCFFLFIDFSEKKGEEEGEGETHTTQLSIPVH